MTVWNRPAALVVPLVTHRVAWLADGKLVGVGETVAASAAAADTLFLQGVRDELIRRRRDGDRFFDLGKEFRHAMVHPAIRGEQAHAAFGGLKLSRGTGAAIRRKIAGRAGTGEGTSSATAATHCRQMRMCSPLRVSTGQAQSANWVSSGRPKSPSWTASSRIEETSALQKRSVSPGSAAKQSSSEGRSFLPVSCARNSSIFM